MGEGIEYFHNACEVAYLNGFSRDPESAAASVTFVPVLIDNMVPPYFDGLGARLVFSDDAQGIWAFRVATKIEESPGFVTITYTGVVGPGAGLIPGDLDADFVGTGADLSNTDLGEMVAAGVITEGVPEPTACLLLLSLVVAATGRSLRFGRNR